MSEAMAFPVAGILSDPADVQAISEYIRRIHGPVAVFRWFRRLLMLPGSYAGPNTLSLDGDVVRKALRSGAAITDEELAQVANSSSREDRTSDSFIAASLLVTKRLNDPVYHQDLIKYNKCRNNFERSIAHLLNIEVPEKLLQAQSIVTNQQIIAGILRTAGYSDEAIEICRSIADFSRAVRKRIYGNAFRAFTDRWTFSIGHMVVLAYLLKAQDSGLAEVRGGRIWTGVVANQYLMDLILSLSSDIAFVEPFTLFGDNHASNHPEWLEGAYRNLFDACGLIADRAGSETGAILSRPTFPAPAFSAFLGSTGLGPTDRIVTVHCREAGFRADSRHDLRNMRIETCLPALRMLVARGYKVVRMGDSSMTPLPETSGVIDYATSNMKSQELDVLLTAVADFHVGTSSGLSLVPLLFGKPCLYLDWYPSDLLPWGRQNWTVLRPLRALNEDSPVIDPELYFKFGRMLDRSLLRAAGYEPLKLTEQQVVHAVEAFVQDLEKARRVPEKTGRNIGRILMAAGHAASEPFLEVPRECLTG